MRVSDRMIYDSAVAHAERSRARHQLAADRASSGLRVTHPGDDPASAGLLAKYRIDKKTHQAIEGAVNRAGEENLAADNALGELHNLLVRARELAMQMANDTYDATERANSAVEVDALFRSAVALMNTEFGGRFVFGGNRDNTPPFDAAGNYLGDTGVRLVEIAPGVHYPGSIRADIAVKGVGGGVDVLNTLTGLVTALQTNNAANIRGSLTDISSGIAQISAVRVQVGTISNVMDNAAQVARLGQEAATLGASREGDADAIATFSELSLAEHALEATLTAAAKTFTLSLLDKL